MKLPIWSLKPVGTTALRTVLALAAVVIAAVTAHSIHIANLTPDPQETVIFGQSRIGSDSPAAMRILVRHFVTGQPIENAQVKLSLEGEKERVALGTATTDPDGTVTNTWIVPDTAPGNYTLHVEVASSLGRDSIARQVEVYRPAQILVTTDKAVYQPGQTIHLRALVTNGRTLKPFAGEEVTFEISDTKGNKVFKETQTASQYGLVSADFELASEVDLGQYRLEVRSGTTKTERTVDVRRYVLPKFKVGITTNRAWYRPRQLVEGTLSAQYFFGKPVSHAQVVIRSATMHEKPVALGQITAQTDANGRVSFSMPLPTHLSGMAQNGGQAYVELIAEVTDSGGQNVTVTRALSVSANDLDLSIIPEGGLVVPGIENRFFVLASYPDGSSAECEILKDGQVTRTDPQGLAILTLKPEDKNFQFNISARDPQGRTASKQFVATNDASVASLLLRTDKPVYQAGESAHLSILGASGDGIVFLDIIRDRQTVLTRSLSLKQGYGELTLPLPADLVGQISLNAYLISSNGEDIGCHRQIYISPAGGLNIEAKADQNTYRPGDIANLEFTLRDASGKPAPGAMGISIVDESVFAMQANQPGLLGQFLESEGDLLKRQSQTRFFQNPYEILNGPPKNNLLAEAWFSARNQYPAATVQIDRAEDYLGRGTLEKLRSMRGTPSYESLRLDQEWGPLISQLEGGTGLNVNRYDVRESTGPFKKAQAEQRKKDYFNRLKGAAVFVFVGFLLLGPIVLFIWALGKETFTNYVLDRASEPDHPLFRAAIKVHHRLYVLCVLPFALYPLGVIVAQMLRFRDNPLPALLTLECIILIFILLHLIRVWNGIRPVANHSQLSRLLLPFCSMFILTRLFFATMGYWTDHLDDFLVGILILASILSPWFVLAHSACQVKRLFRARGIEPPPVFSSLGGAIVVIGIIFLLGGMLLPSLAKARTTSQKNAVIAGLKQFDGAMQQWALENKKTDDTEGRSTAPRLRQHFPETLFWRPQLITDENGRATVQVPLADSITTWRASLDAVNLNGRLGSTTLSLPVFQDFFVDLDLPVALTYGDQVSVPVVCHNYLPKEQVIRLKLTDDGGFEVPEANRNQQVTLAANEVRALHFPLRAISAGQQRLRITAQGAQAADAVEREVRVVPSGHKFELLKNIVLKDREVIDLDLPSAVIPGSAGLVVKLYPSRFSEIMEGLDSIFQQPYGCFEQTSSTTYPNVLALDYLRSINRLNPKVEAKARQYINSGYQRLLTFEVPGGGFEWFGRAPGNVGLTAYGLMEFHDMSRVHSVDPALLDRTAKWLARLQNTDGSWNGENDHHKWGSPKATTTAYVTWALAETGLAPASRDKALNYLFTHRQDLTNAYVKALTANAALTSGSHKDFGQQLLKELVRDLKPGRNGSLYCDSTGRSITYSWNQSLQVETTALVSLALLKNQEHPQAVKGTLQWLSAQKNGQGQWPTTQATVLAMRALIRGTGAPLAGGDCTVNISLNGQALKPVHITKANNEIMRLISLTRHLKPGRNQVEIHSEPTTGLNCQIAGEYWTENASDHTTSSTPTRSQSLAIDVRYDRVNLGTNEELKCKVKVENQTGMAVPMAIIDLGIPPGFEVEADDFASLRLQVELAKHEIKGNQVVLYLRELKTEAPYEFTYTLRPKYPLKVSTPVASVYEYYNPKNRAESRPVELHVTR